MASIAKDTRLITADSAGLLLWLCFVQIFDDDDVVAYLTQI